MDRDLVIRAQQGDRTAFVRLVEMVGGRFHAAAYSILRDRSLAEDASQQALVGIWRNLPQLRDPERFEAWSYRMLVNTCYAVSKAERRWLPRMPAPDREPVADDGIGQVADRDELERAFRRLSVDHRTAVVLHHYVGLTVGQVAEAVDAPVETVRSRLRYALRALRAAIEADSRTRVVPASLTSAGPTLPNAAATETGTR